MTSLDDRIDQFQHMAEEDPDNDMAHFSLGSAYLQGGRAAEAAASFERCLALNPGMSKAYQLAGQAMIDAGWEDKAVATLTKGFEVAAGRGDLLPRDAIAALLRQIGREPPSLSAEAEQAAEELRAGGDFICRHTGRAGTRLPDAPMRGPVGQWILDNIAAETWQAWIDQGTKVINELRLDFSREEDQHVYDQQMHEFLGIDEAVLEEIKGKAAVD